MTDINLASLFLLSFGSTALRCGGSFFTPTGELKPQDKSLSQSLRDKKPETHEHDFDCTSGSTIEDEDEDEYEDDWPPTFSLLSPFTSHHPLPLLLR